MHSWAIQQSKIRSVFSISQNIPFPTLFKARKELMQEQIKGKEISKELSVNEMAKQIRTYIIKLNI
jgi:cobalt-zinc-cadmium resistance protein CzcA